ncbi:glutamate racemase [Sporosarcina sp. BI001-red]|uniref:glutamate racemase n=1 Tax=Sporosarcina sp. BI001-red TaxID=2282866 RepID=UPI000E248914|nr:glutamate racemase [Sporosarcina sp. BI001-red]REB06624.1 glutamate racemase [Sporosarcina sp. BI001-red]
MKELSDLPIGIIDSGVGGLTVMDELLKRMPNEQFLYIGDDARCPYGNRSPQEVAKFTFELISALNDFGVKMVVIACNTATAFALEHVRPLFDFPIIGVIEPGARTAVEKSVTNQIVVLGTSGTVKSQAYDQAILTLAPDASVRGLACPEFVPIVERGVYKLEEADRVVEQTLAQLADETFDAVILGCTHFPLLSHFIRKHLPIGTELITSGSATADTTIRILDELQLNRESLTEPQSIFYTTGNPAHFELIVKDWLHIANPVVEKLVL